MFHLIPTASQFAPAEWDREAEYLVTVETVSNPFKCILVGINPAEADCPWRDTEERYITKSISI